MIKELVYLENMNVFTSGTEMDNTIGVNIRKYRKLCNMRQEDLALAAGTHLNSIVRYESGIRKPSVKVLKQLAAALKITFYDLTGLAQPTDEVAETASDDYYRMKYEELLKTIMDKRTKIEIVDERGQVCEFFIQLNGNLEVTVSNKYSPTNCYCADVDEHTDDKGAYDYIKVKCDYK